MPCQICGAALRGGRTKHCKTCARTARRMQDSRARQNKASPDAVDYECTECGAVYSGVLSTPCPECGETRCRATQGAAA